MQVIWTVFGRRPRLADWEAQPFSPRVELGPRAGDRRDAHEREVGNETPGPPEADGPFRRAERAILGFRVYPPRLVTPVVRRDPVQAGDTVGICYHVAWGVDLFCAARVVTVFDEAAGQTWRAGFTYRTLLGHPEFGEESFSVEKDAATGLVSVALRCWSRPALLLTRMAAPLARRWQLQAAGACLDHLATLARGAVAH